MSLDTDLANDRLFTPANRRSCTVCDLIAEMKPETAKKFQARMEDKKVTHSSISKVLKANGHAINGGTIGRHRAKQCSGRQ